MKGGLIGINRKHYLEKREYILYSNFDSGHSISYLYYFNIYHISNNLSMPLDPLLYYAPKGNSTPLKCHKAYQIQRFIRKKKQTQSFFICSLFSLSLSFFFFFLFVRVVGVISIWDTRGGGGGPPKKFIMKRGGHHIQQ